MYEQSSDSNFEIEQVLNDRIIEGRLYYFVKWKGYPHSQNSWQPEEHLINAPQHVQLWKQRKNKLRKLDKVSKRKKDEESFDGKKYIKKNRPPGPMGAAQNKQVNQANRKSKRIKQKDDTAQGRLNKDFDSQKASQNQQSESSSKKNNKTSKNSLFQVLSSIQKINKQKRQRPESRKSFLDELKNPQPNQQQVPKKKRGRKKKEQKEAIKQKSKQTITFKKRPLQINKHLNSKQSAHKNDHIPKLSRQQKHNKQQEDQQQTHNMQVNKHKEKPQIYDEILHYSNDNIQRSRYHALNQKSNKNGKNNDGDKRSRKNSMAELSVGFDKSNFQCEDNINIIKHQQQPKRPNQPSWIVDSSLNLFDQKGNSNQQKNSKIFDELQQIGLSESKRMPNFLDKYGLLPSLGNNNNNKNKILQPNNKRTSHQIANSNIPTRPFNQQLQPQIQPQTNLYSKNNRLYKSQVSPGFHNTNNYQIQQISSQSSNNNIHDDSLVMIRKEDYTKSVKGSKPGKKIFLNQEYKQVSINIDSVAREMPKQCLNKSTGFVPISSQIDTPCDPRFIHRAKLAAQQLYDFLFKTSSLRRFELPPKQYIKSLTNIARNQIKKKGICIDLQELERREIERNWSVQQCNGQDEQVWVLQEAQVPKKNNLTTENIDSKINVQSSPHHKQSTTPTKHQVTIIQQPSISSSQKQTTNSQTNSTKPSQQQSDDIQLLKGLQQDILDLFRQRYPSQPITIQIKQQISKIVRKIAYENMEIEVGLGLVEEWLKKREGMGQGKPQRVQQNNLLTSKNNISDDLKKSSHKKMQRSRDSQQGELTISEDSESSRQTSRTRSEFSAHTSLQQTKPKPLPAPESTKQPTPSKPSQLPKPTQVIQQSNIVKIIQQFQYKNQRCFKLLLKNDQKVNVHYLQLKKNCPKVLFDYLEIKCQQFQKQYMIKGAKSFS